MRLLTARGHATCGKANFPSLLSLKEYQSEMRRRSTGQDTNQRRASSSRAGEPLSALPLYRAPPGAAARREFQRGKKKKKKVVLQLHHRRERERNIYCFLRNLSRGCGSARNLKKRIPPPSILTAGHLLLSSIACIMIHHGVERGGKFPGKM